MYKFVVNFKQPAKLDEFEGVYTDFLALIERMPHIERRQVVHVTGSPIGQAPYYRILEIYFASQEIMRQALLSPEGQEAGNELGRLKVGTFDVYFAEVYEETGGNTPEAPSATESDEA